MSPSIKLILAGVLIVIALNLFFYAHVRRRIAAAKEEGYRRLADDADANGSKESGAEP